MTPSVSTTSTALVCAIASMISTPGITGSTGKCPWKCGSLTVTFLMPTAERLTAMFTTRSISRNG